MKNRRRRAPVRMARSSRPSYDAGTWFAETTAIIPQHPNETVFQPDETIEGVAETVETATKGRTWPDLAHQFAIDPRYHYLILFVIFAIIALSTGRLNSLREATALGGVTLTSWVILVIQRKGDS